MAQAEKATPLIRAEILELEPQTSETILPAGTAGRVKTSGGKLYIDDGTSWDLVTSA